MSEQPEQKKYCGLVKGNLVYDKHTRGVIGFTHLGTEYSVDYNCRQSVIHRARTPNGRWFIATRGRFDRPHAQLYRRQCTYCQIAKQGGAGSAAPRERK